MKAEKEEWIGDQYKNIEKRARVRVRELRNTWQKNEQVVDQAGAQ